ncbi:hypothetical protein [Xanthomonas phage NEB7]|nr:hypothetical protein [Xanthomonas phage NEB7]
MSPIPIRAIIYTVLVAAVLGGLYWLYAKGARDATTEADLQVTKEAVAYQAEAITVGYDIRMRVDAETTDTRTQLTNAQQEIAHVKTDPATTDAERFQRMRDVALRAWEASRASACAVRTADRRDCAGSAARVD